MVCLDESRYQVTSVENCQSTQQKVPVGVPQGSILGPLLFLIYVNDLPNCLEHCQAVMYADDTVIYFSSNCCQNIQYHLNADLANLAESFNNNYLTLNTSKSKFVLFGGDRRLQTCQDIKLVTLIKWPWEGRSINLQSIFNQSFISLHKLCQLHRYIFTTE